MTAMSDRNAAMPRHPSAERGKVSSALLAFGVLGGPVAWMAQFLVNYGLASNLCWPGGAQRFTGTGGALLAINVVALVVAAAAALASYQGWRATRGEHAGGAGHLLEAGEGLSRFVAACGMMLAIGFLLATAANTVALFMVPPCVR